LRHRAVVDFLLAAYFVSKMQDVDVVYATFGDRKLFTGYFCKRFTGKPLTVTIHAYELYANPNPPLFPIALEACDQIVTVTEYNRDVLRDRFQVDPKRVEVVRLSVDLEEYKPADKFIVLIVAFFVEKKGHEVLFKAIRELGYDDIEVWVVGGDGGSDSHVDVHELARQHGVENQVAFFGKLSGTALRAVYHACDVFCLPSRFDSDGQGEGFPTVIIEAMACGKPVVTTNHVEIPRIVEQLVVPENDAAALAEALQTTYASRHLRETMGKRNRELAEIHFSNANTEEKLNLFRELCKGMAAQQDHLAEATENHNQHCLAIEEVV
jgi:glycosyltransferase involved in cell wall biosynthesis